MEEIFYHEYGSKYFCPQACKRRYWQHDVTDNYVLELSLSMSAAATTLRREEEVETYPLAQLFSDTGGSLGLFLGVSLLTVWELLMMGASCCLKPWINTENNGRNMHVATVTKYTGILLLAIGTCTHSLVTVQSYLSQPKLTSVSLRVQSPSTESENTSVTTLVARRLAMQALSCRPQETAQEECQVTCLLEQTVSEIVSVAPFVRVEGLPQCQDVRMSLPSLVYVVPPEMLLFATHGEKVDMCHKNCSHLLDTNSTQHKQSSPSLLMTVNSSHYSFDTLQLVCSIGGIVGLYLGYSIFDALELSHSLIPKHNRLTPSGMTTEKSSQTVLNIMKIAVCIICVVLALWQFHTFLMNHEISTTVSQTEVTSRSDQLNLIVCRWPPLSFDHVTELLGTNMSEKILMTMEKEERLPELLKVLETLPGNWTMTLDDIWNYAAWNISNVIEAFYVLRRDGGFFSDFCARSDCTGLWVPVMTPLNRCFSFNATHNDIDIVMIALVFPEVLQKANIFGLSPQIYFTVNPTDQLPLLANMLPRTQYKRTVATYYSAKYKHLDQQRKTSDDNHSDTSYSSCVHECLAEGATSELNCRLPYLTWRPELPPCNQSQYQAVPSYFKGLEGIGKDWDWLKNKENTSQDLIRLHEECYSSCHHLQDAYNVLTSDDTVHDMYSTVVVHLDQEKDTVVVEEDHYTVSQLLSDLGGIAGSMAGISLMFLLKDMMPRLMAAHRYK